MLVLVHNETKTGNGSSLNFVIDVVGNVKEFLDGFSVRGFEESSGQEEWEGELEI